LGRRKEYLPKEEFLEMVRVVDREMKRKDNGKQKKEDNHLF
jgi:hypothetical protein